MTTFSDPFHLRQWVEDHADDLRPPIGNRQLFKGQWENLLTMVVGGPNQRSDYHINPGGELFYQVEGDIILKIMDAVMGLRVNQQEELQGLDVSQHGEEGYIFL